MLQNKIYEVVTDIKMELAVEKMVSKIKKEHSALAMEVEVNAITDGENIVAFIDYNGIGIDHEGFFNFGGQGMAFIES